MTFRPVYKHGAETSVLRNCNQVVCIFEVSVHVVLGFYFSMPQSNVCYAFVGGIYVGITEMRARPPRKMGFLYTRKRCQLSLESV